MSYESAPATKLIATRCAACGRPLVDAKSVETGMGPDCRKKHGYNVEVSEEARAEANKIVYNIAATYGAEGLATLQSIDRLQALGFHQLAEILADRVAAIRVFEERGLLIVHTPYNEDATPDWRAIPGRRWVGSEKANHVPATQRKLVYALLLRHFNGALGIGPKGGFIVGTKPTTPSPAPAPAIEDVEAEMHRMEAEGDREQTEREEKRKDAIRNLMERGCPAPEAERIVANVEAGKCPDGCCGGEHEHDERDDESELDEEEGRRDAYKAALEAAELATAQLLAIEEERDADMAAEAATEAFEASL